NEQDGRFYSHFYVRRLPAEVLLDALCQSTGVPEAFPGYPAGLRAAQLPDTAPKSYFLTLFGKSERVTACACERSGEVTMPQLLHLENGDSVVQKIGSPQGRLAGWLRAKRPDAEVIDELFLATLSRPASAAEREAVLQSLAKADNRDEFYRDL